MPSSAISGEFSGLDVPESVLADAFFEKGQYSPESLFQKITALLEEIPQRPRIARQPKAAVWIPVKGDVEYIAVTCSSCLRTFPIPAPLSVAYTLRMRLLRNNGFVPDHGIPRRNKE